MFGWNAARNGSLPNHAQVVFSVHLSLSVMCEKARNHGACRNGSAFDVSINVMFVLSAPSKFSV